MIDASIYRSWSHRLALPLITISSILLPHAAYMYARSSSHREASATEEAEAAQGCSMGLSLCSQQISPPKPEIATRGLLLPNTAASHQGRGEGNKQQMATTVPAIQSNEQLKKVLRQAKEPNSNLVVLEFTAPWSEPCKFMRPALEKVASDFKDQADFYTLDVEQFKTFARNTRVEALPTFLLVRKTILERVIGVSKDELQRSIEKHISGIAIDHVPTRIVEV
ncbi:thioredoxin H-type 2-like [Panicum miliaceum]|uniref:Thioredoxin H-type 2-like n=1 Tax=Panicum miliaceum TaxID=4540 RepID=A0A3L6PD40_PANMI|nr:thioredoxin H-type 2-like [Panicum miliaceum]